MIRPEDYWHSPFPPFRASSHAHLLSVTFQLAPIQKAVGRTTKAAKVNGEARKLLTSRYSDGADRKPPYATRNREGVKLTDSLSQLQDVEVVHREVESI
jgi:hypothetical protein